CFFERTTQADSGPTRNAVEPHSRAKHRERHRSGRAGAAGDAVVLQPARNARSRGRYGGCAHSGPSRAGESRFFSLEKPGGLTTETQRTRRRDQAAANLFLSFADSVFSVSPW